MARSGESKRALVEPVHSQFDDVNTVTPHCQRLLAIGRNLLPRWPRRGCDFSDNRHQNGSGKESQNATDHDGIVLKSDPLKLIIALHKSKESSEDGLCGDRDGLCGDRAPA